MREVRATPVRGLSLIEVMIVMAILALSAGLAGPRIGAGLARLEMSQTDETLKSFVQMARLAAQRSDRPHFVIMDGERDRILLLDPDMRVLREGGLPASVEVVPNAEDSVQAIHVPPSGLLRTESLRLRSRLGVSEVGLR